MTEIEDTRARLICAAAALFAEKGFYGASIAAIAQELGFTKQALLHHFGSKEKLYGAVLAQISDELVTGLISGLGEGDTPEQQLEEFFAEFCQSALEDGGDIKLILRELMDNKARAETAGVWYLKDFLETLVALVQATTRWQGSSAPQALAVVYQLLGAVSYFVVSEPTLGGIFGKEGVAQARRDFPKTFAGLVKSSLL